MTRSKLDPYSEYIVSVFVFFNQVELFSHLYDIVLMLSLFFSARQSRNQNSRRTKTKKYRRHQINPCSIEISFISGFIDFHERFFSGVGFL